MQLQATEGRDVLAYIPHAIGFEPKESLVAITMAEGKLRATLRINLPPHDLDPLIFARQVLSYLRQDTVADGALLAVYTDEPGERPFEEHILTVFAELTLAGMQPREVFLVTSDHWQGYVCAGDPDCCPPQPLETIKDSALHTEMVFAGYAPETGVRAPECGDPEASADALAANQVVQDAPHARLDWMNAVTTGELTPEGAYQIITNMNLSVSLRDRLMADLIDTDDALERVGAVLVGAFTEAPDWQRIDLGYELMVKLLTYAPPANRAPILTGLAWIEWLRGRGSHASTYLELALEDRQSYRLAELLLEVLNRGLLPAVAMTQTTAWHKPGLD